MIDYVAGNSWCSAPAVKVRIHDGSWSLGLSRIQGAAPAPETPPDVALPGWVNTGLAGLAAITAGFSYLFAAVVVSAVVAVPALLLGAGAIWFLSSLSPLALAVGVTIFFCAPRKST